MWEDLAIKLGLKAVEKFFDGKSKEEQDVISIGLAVGYYYNFLDPISMVIDQDDLELFSTADGKDGRKFAADDVKLQIILPQRLDVHAFKRCESEFKEAARGFVFLKQNKRYYGINYALSQLGKKQELIIIDLARPLMSVKRYYEDILNIPTHDETNELWLKTQVTEITAFKEALRRLQKRGYGGLVNQLDFRERG